MRGCGRLAHRLELLENDRLDTGSTKLAHREGLVPERLYLAPRGMHQRDSGVRSAEKQDATVQEGG